MIGPRALLLALSIWAALPPIAGASNRYDPRLVFRTITTPRFEIHFHQGEEGQARRLAVLAEDVAAKVEALLGRPSGKVHLILVNQTDRPNGWAIPVPINLIEITAAAPGGDNPLGASDDWLRLVLTHEYTHIVHLGRSGGWIGGLRRVFGRLPLLYPNLFQPRWLIEGVATFEESAGTGGGRLYAGDFRLLAERAAGSGRFLSVDRAAGGLTDFPWGDAPYVYGGLFHEHLAEDYGEASIRELADATARRLPFFGAAAYREVYGKSLGELWERFEADAQSARTRAARPAAARRLTHHGFDVAGPRFGPDGRVYYSTVNPHGFPALMSISLDEPRSRQVATRFLGTRLGFAGDEIVFDELELVQNVGLQSDLHAVSSDGRARRRLTRGARAADPDVSPDGGMVVFTVQRADGRTLAWMNLPAPGALGVPVALNDDPMTDWSAPRWSPDGRWIAAERRVLHGPSEIVLIERQSRSIRRLVASRDVRNTTPAWTADGRRLLFARSSRSEGFTVHSVEIESGTLARLSEAAPNAHSPDMSRDGRTLVYVGYSDDGDDLFVLDLDGAAWTPFPAEPAAADGGVIGEPPAVTARPYSPWSTLAPRFWTPILESDAGEVVAGGATGGYDALGRHAFGVEAGWSTRARPDWRAAYAYDRWWPTFFLDVADDTDPWRDGTVRTREVNAGALLPVRRVRWSQQLLAALHASTDRFTPPAGGGDEARVVRRAVRTGWLVDAARAYGYSISEADGWSATVGLELSREAFGADADTGAATVDARGYLPLGARHAVLAARAAAATSWGDGGLRRVFSAAGSEARGRGFAFGSDAIGLLRGAEESDVLGHHAVVVNVDYRLPLVRFERGAGTVPVFVRTLHGALFADIGHAWTERFRFGDVAHSIGAELSIDAVLGHAVPVTFSGGVAWRTLADGGGIALFGRVGRAF